MLSNLATELAPYFWEKRPCTIRKAEIAKTEPQSYHYTFAVLYDYEVNGKIMQSNRWRRISVEPFDSYSALSDKTGKYTLQPNHFCYVNPGNPSEAVLQRENPLRVLLLVFPLLMIIPGAVGLLKLFKPEAIPPVARRPRLRFGLQLVAAGVVGFGLFLFVIFFVRAVFDLIRAAKWEQTTCQVIDSYLHTDAASTTGTGSKTRGYRLRILYSYIYGGKDFLADRYNFVRWGTGGKKLTHILNQYRAETKVDCFINPGKPYQAVLNRSFSLRYLMGLLPMLISAAGMVLFLVARRS